VSSVFGPIDSLAGAMSYHRERNSVLVGNLGNIETPGYRPADLQRTVTGESGGLAVTNPGHIGGGANDNVLVFDDGGNLQGPDGNAVALERELAKIDANRVRYNTSAELVTRRLAMLRYAAGDGVG
jgi:flagellar basal-body rod protein FlgB